MLPARSEDLATAFRLSVFDEAFEVYVDAIRREPLAVRHHVVESDDTSVSFVFNPGKTTTTISYPPYNLAHDHIHNVVHNALDAKLDQLKRSGPRVDGEMAGIILCDGGCGMLRSGGGCLRGRAHGERAGRRWR